MRKLIVGSAKFCFGVFIIVLIGFIISYFVSANFLEFIDSYGPEAFMDKVTEFFQQFG